MRYTFLHLGMRVEVCTHSTRVATLSPLSAGRRRPRTPLAALLASIQAAYWLAVHTFNLLPFSSLQMIDRRKDNADVHRLLVMMLIQGCATARHQRIETS